MEAEVWITAHQWNGFYEVSSFGRVRSIIRKLKNSLGVRSYGGSLVNPIFHKRNKYLVVNLTANGLRKQVLIHRLVLESFVCACPIGKEACHNDGNRLNPKLSNLRWDTRKNNHADKKLHGTWQGGEKNPARKLTESAVNDIRSSMLTLNELAIRYCVSRGCIEKAKYGSTWKHL